MVCGSMTSRTVRTGSGSGKRVHRMQGSVDLQGACPWLAQSEMPMSSSGDLRFENTDGNVLAYT